MDTCIDCDEVITTRLYCDLCRPLVCPFNPDQRVQERFVTAPLLGWLAGLNNMNAAS